MFVIAIITLSAVTARSWMHPKYPSKVDGENKKNSSRKVAHLGINRQIFSPQSVNQIVENNLFQLYVAPSEVVTVFLFGSILTTSLLSSNPGKNGIKLLKISANEPF